MKSLSTQWNEQLIRCVFSKVIEFLKQNNRKQTDCKDHQTSYKWTEYKIFILKCENIELSKVLK